MARPNRAALDLDALRHNLAHARSLAPHSRAMAVVKANAYGHGAVTVAKGLEAQVDAFAVACIEEALELRFAGIAAPILLLQGIFSRDELAEVEQHNLWVMIENEAHLCALEEATLRRAVTCWLKVDSGMHRLGVDPARADACFKRLKNSRNAAQDIVLCSHFASADNLASDQTERQIDCFEQVCAGLPGPRSMANSPGILAWPRSHFDWIRPGYMLYGNSPFAPAAHPNAEALQPVMTLQSAVISLREVQPGGRVGYGGNWTAGRVSRIATVTVGYGDGYPRLAKNGTPVLVNGQRAPLAGRVSMDMITVDVTDVEGVQVGDTVTLWGEGLSVGEVAACAGTIGYEIIARMPPRTPRVVVRG